MKIDEDEIAIVIPIYKITEGEQKNILQLLDKFKISVVVDDSGENDEVLKDCLREINCEYLTSGKEQGLSTSVNQGIEHAISKGAKWVFLINQDNTVDSSIIRIYLDYINSHSTDKIALLAPQCNYDRHVRKAGAGYNMIRYADMTGSLINCDIFKKIGGYDSRFFIDGLDVEWCLRARKKGYNLIRCNKAIINHKPGETRKLKMGKYEIVKFGWHSASRYYYQYKAAFLIHQMYHDLQSDLFNVYKVIKSFTLFDNRHEYFNEFCRAFKDYRNGYYGPRKLE